MKILVVISAMLLSTSVFANESIQEELKLPVAVQSPKTGKVLVQSQKQTTHENEKEEEQIIQELQRELLIEANVEKTVK